MYTATTVLVAIFKGKNVMLYLKKSGPIPWEFLQIALCHCCLLRIHSIQIFKGLGADRENKHPRTSYCTVPSLGVLLIGPDLWFPIFDSWFLIPLRSEVAKKNRQWGRRTSHLLDGPVFWSQTSANAHVFVSPIFFYRKVADLQRFSQWS